MSIGRGGPVSVTWGWSVVFLERLAGDSKGNSSKTFGDKGMCPRCLWIKVEDGSVETGRMKHAAGDGGA